jgi:exopolysaccharide/PEP-CTERM locus tyrosine autokinase
MIITCQKCNTRYRIRDEVIPPGKTVSGTCKHCGIKLVVARDGGHREDTPSSTLPVPISYINTRIVRVAEDILRRNRLEAFFDDSPMAEYYRVLKTQILQLTREKGLNTLLVTSAGDNEGKSLTAANLAISLAKELQHTVLLVDADLKRPSLHNLFDIDPPGSLSDALYCSNRLAGRLVNPGINKLTMLLGNQSFSNSAEIMGSPAMRELIDEMKHRYADRYIIFDAPPVLGAADSLILSRYVDGVVMVVAHNETQGEDLYKAMDLLKAVNVLGTVLNKAPLKRHSYR